MKEKQVEEDRSARKIPLATEILSYLGGVLVVAASIALLTVFWDQLGVVGQLGISGLVAAAALAGGVFLGRIDDRAAQRLQQFLLCIGVAASGVVAGIATWHVLSPYLPVQSNVNGGVLDAGNWAVFVGGLMALAVGVAVYWFYRYVGPQIAVAAAVVVSCIAGVILASGGNPPGWAMSGVLVAAGLAWFVYGLVGWLPPGENTALALSGTMMGAGLVALAGYSFELESQGDVTHWPMYAALAGAVALLVAGVSLKRLITVGFGAATTVVVIPMLLSQVFSGSIGVPVAILMLGVVLMLAAVFFAWREPKRPHIVEPEGAPPGVAIAPEGVPAPPAKPVRRIPVVSEVLGYIGGAFALGAGIALIFFYADTIGVYGQIAVCAIAALAGLVGGFSIGRVGDKPSWRLEQFLLTVGATGAGAAVGLGAYRAISSGVIQTSGLLAPANAADWAWFLGSATAALVGGAVWWFRRTWLQEIVFGVAVAMTCVTALLIPQTEGPDWVLGAVLCTVGIIWGALGFAGAIKPVNAAIALGALGIEGGILAMAVMGISGEQPPYAWALWLGVAVSAIFVLAGGLLRRWWLLGIGALGLWQFLNTLIQVVFANSPIAPILFLGLGVLLVGGGIAWAVITARRGGGHHPVAT